MISDACHIHKGLRELAIWEVYVERESESC